MPSKTKQAREALEKALADAPTDEDKAMVRKALKALDGDDKKKPDADAVARARADGFAAGAAAVAQAAAAAKVPAQTMTAEQRRAFESARAEQYAKSRLSPTMLGYLELGKRDTGPKRAVTRGSVTQMPQVTQAEARARLAEIEKEIG